LDIRIRFSRIGRPGNVGTGSELVMENHANDFSLRCHRVGMKMKTGPLGQLSQGWPAQRLRFDHVDDARRKCRSRQEGNLAEMRACVDNVAGVVTHACQVAQEVFDSIEPVRRASGEPI
jgi:hypothetical protein